MDEDKFWAVIEECRADSGGDLAALVNSLERSLSMLPADEAAAFFDRWQAVGERARRWLVWDAACVLLSWTIDDSFADFRAWLITRGRAAFKAVVDDPDNLADLAGELLATAWAVAEQLDGVVGWAASAAKGVEHPAEIRHVAEPGIRLGEERLDLDDAMAVRARLPRVWDARHLV
ncbi:DUF4240 domain-containing protein [Actinomadura sp. NAK00032]|uniref:DUF4240 domain-containing protein n=1 Tax=Actinomadura sp. NAK00032 TaxID=2742128 RepID=UPI00159018AC|nr:DUF4240 domain-containing protein [Actinomadura sp. NAK00032]QKW32749.1 DUF4240 domain-containing protein [Actinomadura sp. NAK00032]